jgi:phage/plasmid-like protein (TIGR03299 family)
MPAAVETMAYTNEVPWHGIGTYRENGWKNVKDLCRDAGIAWRVERQPIFANGKEIPGFAALVRDSDNTVFDVVGSRYIPVQNEEAFEFFTEFVKAGDATLETAGSLRGGRYVWGLAKLNAEFTLRGNDQVKGFLLVGLPHEQGKAALFKSTAVRVVCQNTLALALKDSGAVFKIHHRTTFDNNTILRAKETMGLARERIGDFERNARKLQKLSVSDQDTVRLLAKIYQPEVDVNLLLKDFDNEASPKMKQMMDILVNAPGAQPGNGWGLLNAVTYYSDHVASRTVDRRLSNAWMGKTARQKEEMLDNLLEMVD